MSFPIRAPNPIKDSPRAMHPALNALSITPSDSAELVDAQGNRTETRGLYVGVSGDVKVTMASGDEVTFGSLAAGVIHPLRVSLVWSTGTTATGIVGVY